MNAMCDLTQFFVSTPTYNITADNLAKIFKGEVFLIFLMCAVIVIDYVSTFKNIFQQMCEVLKITYWCISREKNKGNSVKKFHQFQNMTQTTTGGHQGTHTGFIQNAKISYYSWNISLVDDTDISQILAAIGWEF